MWCWNCSIVWRRMVGRKKPSLTRTVKNAPIGRLLVKDYRLLLPDTKFQPMMAIGQPAWGRWLLVLLLWKLNIPMSGHGREKWANWSKTRDYYSGVGIRPNPAWSASPGSAEDDLLSLPSLMISVVEPFVTVCGERFHLFTHQQTLSSGLLCS